jgi:hypothetical protein
VTPKPVTSIVAPWAAAQSRISVNISFMSWIGLPFDRT